MNFRRVLFMFSCAVLGLAMCLLTTTAGLAQSIVTGAITGTVTDPSGAVVAGATVTLTNVATGETQAATTSPSGLYLFPLLKPGGYTVRVERSGFKSSSEEVQVLLGQTVSANVKLELGSSTQTVEVMGGAASLLHTEDANITSTVETRTVEKIPNPGGDLTAIAQLAPGVQMNTTNTFGYGNFSAFGLPGTANLFTINGNDYNDPFLNLNNSGSSNLLLGANEVQEVAVVVNGYTGQYGRQAGAQINYTTKSGTNAFHGDAVYYWTGRALTANDFFLNKGGVPRPFENNNAWAANFGGPIIKNKAFFFADTEGTRYVLATSNNPFLPTPAFQAFVLGNVGAASVPFYQNMFNIFNATPGIARATPTPNSCPASAAAAVPSGNCTESLFNSGANGNREWRLSTRGDYDFNDNNKFSARWTIDRGVQPTYTDPFTPLFNIASTQPQWDTQGNYTHVFNPQIVNNFIASILYYSAIFESTNTSKALATFPYNILFVDGSLGSSGFFGLGGFNGNFFPQGRRSTQWQLVDDLSIARGNHDFKVGVAFRRNDFSDFSAEAFGYPEVFETIGAFAQGNSAFGVSQSFHKAPSQPLAYYSLGLYFQDEYRVNSRLKLTLTLRADRNSNGVCQSNCGTLSAVPFNELDHSAAIPFSQMVNTGRHQILRDVEKVVFEPRIGMAWSPFGQNTVLRGGVGLFTDLYPGVLLDTYTRNFPAVTSFALGPGPLSNAVPTSGAALIGQCNAAFQTTFNNPAGTLANYVAAAPAGCGVPQLGDVTGKTLNPKYLEWNFEVQHTFGSKTVVSVNYVGNRGYDLILSNPYLNGFGFAGLPATAPDARVSTADQLTNAGYSNSNGVTASVSQRLWHGFSGGASYTYSHAIDNISNGGVSPYSLFTSLLNQINPNNPRVGYASSDNDLRHYFSANYVWDIPMKSGNHLLNEVIGGWTVSGTFFYHTGAPFTLVDGSTAGALSGNNMSFFGGVSDTVVAQPNTTIRTTCTNVNLATPCWTPSQFAPSTGFAGGRNAIRQAGYFGSDFSLRKEFKFRERFGFTVGANAFNVFNHPNFFAPSGNLSSPTFGVVTSTAEAPTSPYGSFAGTVASARLVQVLGKITF